MMPPAAPAAKMNLTVGLRMTARTHSARAGCGSLAAQQRHDGGDHGTFLLVFVFAHLRKEGRCVPAWAGPAIIACVLGILRGGMRGTLRVSAWARAIAPTQGEDRKRASELRERVGGAPPFHGIAGSGLRDSQTSGGGQAFGTHSARRSSPSRAPRPLISLGIGPMQSDLVDRLVSLEIAPIAGFFACCH